MLISENIDLSSLTTFGVEARANWRVCLESEDDIILWANDISRDPRFFAKPVLPLGGGSNALFTEDFPGVILSISLPGGEIISRAGSNVKLRLGAGENWHKTVEYCIDNGLYGIENLALIPGSVGAAPIQNIGAYGVEIENYISSVEYFDLIEREYKTLTREECNFGYRSSIFKESLKSRCIISAVTLALSEIPSPNFNYADVGKYLREQGVTSPTPRSVFDAITAIRKRKLPDPNIIGNAGSFFKNPVIIAKKAIGMRAVWPDVPIYEQRNGMVKIPAAWLIDRAGWKGFRQDDAGVFPTQSLVLVNYGKAKGADILKLARDITQSVREMFDITLEYEVNIIGGL